VRFIPLGSGSRGNATLVELAGMRLLVDAGLSERSLRHRLEQLGVPAGSIDAVLLTHEHGDHTRGAPRFSTKHGTPVVCARETLEALGLSPLHFARWVALPHGATLDLGRVRVDAFDVPHDAARPVGFVLEGEGLRIGIAVDLGHATTLVRERLKGCQVLMVESNHDSALLSRGPYPWHLKQRVAGRMGHLSNLEAATLLEETVDVDCRAVVLAHLSEKNNRPDLARRAASAALHEAGARRATMRVAASRGPTPAVEL
jgi:phosphoribosyl 1,2-cyclic phosphodiesterase